MISKNELKVCSGNYNDGRKEFTETYMDCVNDGKHHERRVGLWKFWYPNGKLKFWGLYKEGILVSKNVGIYMVRSLGLIY